MRYLTLLLAILIPQMLHAQTSSQQLTITKAGYFLTVVSSDIPQYVKLTNVIDLTSGQPPTVPTDPPTTPPNPQLDMELVKSVQSWATEVEDPQGAQAMVIVYSIIRQAHLPSPWVVLKKATDSALELIESKQDWESFRKDISAELTERSQKGTLVPDVFLASSQQGLEMSADGSIALPSELQAIIKSNTEGILTGAELNE